LNSLNKMETYAEAITDLIDMVISDYRKLQKVKPDHELLLLITISEDRQELKHSEEYKKRVTVREDSENKNFERLSNYWSALERALEDKPYDDLVK